VEEVKSKKIVVLGQNETVNGLVSNDKRFHLNNDNTPADVVVRIWDIDTVRSYEFSLAQLRCPIKQDVPVIFVCTQKVVLNAQERSKKLGALRSWATDARIKAIIVDIPINTIEGQGLFSNKLGDAISFVANREAAQLERQQTQERLEKERLEIIEQARQLMIKQRVGDIKHFTPEETSVLESAQKLIQPRPRAVRPVEADVQHLSFFGYGFAKPEEASVSHSRQERNNYLEKNLCWSDGDEPTVKMKKLILLFAHYKSIRHVKSTLSERVEEILVRELLNDVDYQDYIANRTNDRATIRGKKHDRVAIVLENKLLHSFGTHRMMYGSQTERSDAEKFNYLLVALTGILDCVDDIERGFFSYKSETGKAQMNGAMELAFKTYATIINKKENYLVNNEVAELTKELTLPKGAIKAMEKLVVDFDAINPLL